MGTLNHGEKKKRQQETTRTKQRQARGKREGARNKRARKCGKRMTGMGREGTGTETRRTWKRTWQHAQHISGNIARPQQENTGTRKPKTQAGRGQSRQHKMTKKGHAASEAHPDTNSNTHQGTHNRKAQGGQSRHRTKNTKPKESKARKAPTKPDHAETTGCTRAPHATEPRPRKTNNEEAAKHAHMGEGANSAQVASRKNAHARGRKQRRQTWYPKKNTKKKHKKGTHKHKTETRRKTATRKRAQNAIPKHKKKAKHKKRKTEVLDEHAEHKAEVHTQPRNRTREHRAAKTRQQN
ncbi:hypothetical protein, conserved in T. vivax [Trypanosoma vivax Y486]|uniref:Uncharacterized protein n=1 Tax=Trypanosoma vivax (strain Y486) TaxID=1055687 RepID=F9WT52_TRYVY|nr:hypothetical protein, conserved in T. vivax [Trypanosoma vivax Y486]|eukprot:CCD20743.1 hypothetical protein, conserved in T. vivax [Trypanosoma vivax Y486]